MSASTRVPRRPGTRLLAAAAIALACGVAIVRLGARQGQEQPTFRAGVDVIQLDVSVLGRDRRPVRGLTLADFTVLEDGKPQRLVTATAVDAAERDPAQSAWMRYVSQDVAINDLQDALGDGRLFAIVLDDMNLPGDDSDIVVSTRAAARYVIEQMGPSDMAAVVFAQQAGKTQDFTSDRQKLLAAIDRFNPNPPSWIGPQPSYQPPIEGDIQRSSGVPSRSQCQREQPAVPALSAVVSRMAVVPNRRKAVLFLSIGVPVSFGGRGCDLELSEMMKSVFRKAQQANVNIHAVDPAGYNGYREYLRMRTARLGRDIDMPGRRRVPTDVRQLQDFLRITADNTGGRAVLDTDAIEPALDKIFEEDASYYLVGYESSNGNPDGKFRRIEVKVNRPGVTVLTRSGYWAPNRGALVNARDVGAPTTTDLSLAGLDNLPGLPLRANIVALGPSADPALAGRSEIAVALSVKLPPLRAQAEETLTLTRTLYDAEGRPGGPDQESVVLTLRPTSGEEQRYDILRRLSLAPGRYQLRYSARSALLGKNGSVYADLEVPDVTRSALTLSALLLGAVPDARTPRTDVLAGLVPVVPTSAREFGPADHVEAFARVYQGDTTVPSTVTMSVEIFNGANVSVFTARSALDVAAFAGGRMAPYQLSLPLQGFSHGPYLLSVTARNEGGRSSRRDMVFRVR